MSENVIIPPIKPFHSLIFGGTDLNSEISSYIIAAETSTTIGRAFPILIIRSFFDQLLSSHKTYRKNTCCPDKKGQMDLKKPFDTGNFPVGSETNLKSLNLNNDIII